MTVRFIPLLHYHHMCFSITSEQVFSLGLDHCIWNRFEALKTWLVSLVKNGKDYLKWERFCQYQWKFKIQMVEWNMCSTEKRKNFHFPVGNKCFMCVLTITIHPLLLYAHFMEGFWPCNHVFFPISQICCIIIYTMLIVRFNFSSALIRKNYLRYRSYKLLWLWFRSCEKTGIILEYTRTWLLLLSIFKKLVIW